MRRSILRRSRSIGRQIPCACTRKRVCPSSRPRFRPRLPGMVLIELPLSLLFHVSGPRQRAFASCPPEVRRGPEDDGLNDRTPCLDMDRDIVLPEILRGNLTAVV